jgi:hypothetical protein
MEAKSSFACVVVDFCPLSSSAWIVRRTISLLLARRGQKKRSGVPC